MNVETIKILEKVQPGKSSAKPAAATGCCGGAPATNTDACCKLDEDKKAEGESGCGCNTTSTSKGSGCC